jgi:hypothetical protein
MHTLLPAHNIYLIDLPVLIVLISLVYSATRFDEWRSILHEAVRWGLRLVLFLVAIDIVLFILHYYNSIVLAAVAAVVLAIVFISASMRHQPS